MNTKTLTCIGCPMGCELTVTYEEGDRDSVTVTGNTCEKGRLYGIDEVISPKRMVTGTVNIDNRKGTVASVKTRESVPKDMVLPIADELKKAHISAPLKIGDTVIENVLDTGVDIIVTKDYA